MLSSTGTLVLLALSCTWTQAASSTLLGVTSAEWVKLNATVSGRLRLTRPFEAPCFSNFEGQTSVVDSAQCVVIQQNYTNPVFRAGYFGAFMQSQWETCQTTGAGCLLDDSEPSNPQAYLGKDCDIGNLAPLYIEVHEPQDIQAAYNFSLKTGIKLSVKNSGHDYKGRSSGKNTLSLWVGSLNSISFDEVFVPQGCNTTYRAISIEPGAAFKDIYPFADKHNATFIGGYARTIGAGYYLGGGHSILFPNFGLGVDCMVQAKIVTPDGQIRTANECQNPDLFWALRGGGGSAFGVVTELTLRVEPQMTLQAAIVQFTPNSSNIAAWYQLTVENSLRWGNEGWGGHITGTGLIHVNPNLNNSAAQDSMKLATDFAIAQGGEGYIDEMPSWNTFFQKYAIAAEAPTGPERILGTRLIPTTLFESQDGLERLSRAVHDVLPFATPYIVAGTPLLYPYHNGSTSVTPAWRKSLWHFGLNARFFFNSTLEQRRAQYAEIHQHTQVFRDMTPGSGAYFNEGDVYEPDHEQSYWGPNYPRLLEIKRKYDPHHLMDCWQCVGWKGPADPQYSCYISL